MLDCLLSIVARSSDKDTRAGKCCYSTSHKTPPDSVIGDSGGVLSASQHVKDLSVRLHMGQNGKFIPRFTEAFELNGSPCFASLPRVWSMPRNMLKPVTFRFAIHPNDHPKLPTATLVPAEKHFTGATLAERRNSVQLYLPLILVVFKSPKVKCR